MVSQRAARDTSSRGRRLAAAAVEFAARGFDGAKVDRIARRARVNKAMLYYHFAGKAAIYRAILTDLFSTRAGAVVRDAGRHQPPEAQLRIFIRTIAAEMDARPHFPALWLREIAEGGRHLDAAIVQSMAAIVGALGAILDAGRTRGVFRPAHPLVIQMSIVAPLLLFAASAPLRARFARSLPRGPHGARIGDVAHEAFIAHIETATLAVLAAAPGPAGADPAGGAARATSAPASRRRRPSQTPPSQRRVRS
jgi:AcrR family transcriptional regulator